MKQPFNLLLTLFFIVIQNVFLNAQNDNLNSDFQDSIDGVFLPDHEVVTSNKEYLKKWRRTKYFVQSVYDYAVISSAMLNAFEDTLAQFTTNRKRSRYLSKANKLLKKEFGNEIRNMSITRGNYLKGYQQIIKFDLTMDCR